ncbi:MAG TPA: spore germination protein [Clostridia bacterium]|nr:spore germination protein [Clostridia bacterium]
MENNAPDINQMYEQLKNEFKNSYDVKVEKIPCATGHEAIVAYIDGMIDRHLLDRDIIGVMKSPRFQGDILKSVVTSIQKEDVHENFILGILNGGLGIYYKNERFLADIKKWERRAIETPDSENVTRGPKEGFTEDLVTNTMLVRRKIRNQNLVLEKRVLGRRSRTAVVVGYIQDLVNEEVLGNVRKRLDEIDCDMVLETGKIEQLIDKKALTPVNGIGLTQKPDIVAAKLMEGRVCVFVDGTPHVIYIPELFIENLQKCEDMYHRSVIASVLRIIRLLGLIIAVLLPGFYISISTFNPEMLPPYFLITVITSTERTPFPEAVEILFLVLMMELLKESGTRLPKTLGSAVSIVGALIIGQAAVDAGLVGAPSVIIVALSAVASFIVPNLNEFVTVYKLIFIVLGALMGLIGLGAGLFFALAQLAAVRSFGIPILNSFNKSELSDGLIRLPMKDLKYRPEAIQKQNIKRMR